MKWLLRPAIKEDIPFIYSSWLKSYRYESNWIHKETSKTVYFETYTRVIDRLLLRSEVVVACKLDENDVMFGYLVHEPNIYHYCFIKEVFRNLGIARDLITQAQPTASNAYCTHRTKDLDRIDHKLTYNPFLLSI